MMIRLSFHKRIASRASSAKRTRGTLFRGIAPLLVASAMAISGCHPTSPKTAVQNRPAVNESQDPWQLTSHSPSDSYGGYLGNGFLGMRFGASGTTDSPDGKAPYEPSNPRGSALSCQAAGLYSKENLIPAPDWGSLQFGVNGSFAQPETGDVANYRQTLDLLRGELTTRYLFPAAHPILFVELTSRVHRDIPGLVTLSARLTPLSDCDVAIRMPPLKANPVYFQAPGGGAPKSGSAVRWELRNASSGANRFLTIAQRLEVLDQEGNVVQAEPGGSPDQKAFSLKAKNTLFATKWAYVIASPTEDAKSVETAQKALDALQEKGHAALVLSHQAAWEKLWRGDVRIDGDLEAQQAVRSSLFYLLGSVRSDGGMSIAPMGLSGTQWGGHIFWDADTWMFPILAILHPDLARSLVDYRFDTLGGAMKNAARNGYKGADYATESALSGEELAPAEYPYHDHYSADVAVAQWRYYLLTGDMERLRAKGYPVLKAVAEYYGSRAIYDAAKDRYEIRHIISPDETAKFVDNDVYSNADAKVALRCAIDASRLLHRDHPKEWETISDKLWLPFDAKNQRYLEHEGYKKTRRPPKQADAELIFYPLGLKAPPAVVANTLTFYADQASKVGPAMTSSVHAVIAARLASENPSGGADWSKKALDYFRESYRPFFRPPFNDFSEKRTTSNVTFLTGCAGVLMGPIYGFGGIEYDAAGIRANPILPPGWKRLRISGIHYRGKVYDLDAEAGRKPVFAPVK